jgi:hypothetical protein
MGVPAGVIYICLIIYVLVAGEKKIEVGNFRQQKTHQP